MGAGGLMERAAPVDFRDNGPRDPANMISKRSGESIEARAALLRDWGRITTGEAPGVKGECGTCVERGRSPIGSMVIAGFAGDILRLCLAAEKERIECCREFALPEDSGVRKVPESLERREVKPGDRMAVDPGEE